MATATSIEWTETTWNPVTGCAKVSPGCAHCYAEGVAKRFWPTQYPGIPLVGAYVDDAGPASRPRAFTDVMTHADRLDQPLRWKKPRKVFVNSMSDLFHEDVPDAFIDQVFAVMALAPRHTFQILTKRAERMKAYFDSKLDAGGCLNEASLMSISVAACEITDSPCAGLVIEDGEWPLPNVWLGVSVENQRFADERIPLLLQTPAAVRFISAEPLLGPVDIDTYLNDWPNWPTGESCERLDWVIVGGESGAGARPFDVAWARLIVQQCHAAGVPVFVKQLGAKPMGSCRPGGCGIDPHSMTFNDRKGGDPSEWPEDLRVRQFPELGV